jgi:hypothetical protein
MGRRTGGLGVLARLRLTLGGPGRARTPHPSPPVPIAAPPPPTPPHLPTHTRPPQPAGRLQRRAVHREQQQHRDGGGGDRGHGDRPRLHQPPGARCGGARGGSGGLLRPDRQRGGPDARPGGRRRAGRPGSWVHPLLPTPLPTPQPPPPPHPPPPPRNRPQFVTNQERLLVEYDNCRVLVTDQKIESVRDIIPILEQVRGGGWTWWSCGRVCFLLGFALVGGWVVEQARRARSQDGTWSPHMVAGPRAPAPVALLPHPPAGAPHHAGAPRLPACPAAPPLTRPPDSITSPTPPTP